MIIENGTIRIAIEIVRENKGSRIIQRIILSVGVDGSRVETANLIEI